MFDYDEFESVVVDKLQCRVRFSIDDSQYRKGIFKLFKYDGRYIEIILDDGGRTRSVMLPKPFKCTQREECMVLSYKMADFDMLNCTLKQEILNCFVKRESKYFNREIKIEWCEK